jgi:hypothetical protein
MTNNIYRLRKFFIVAEFFRHTRTYTRKHTHSLKLTQTSNTHTGLLPHLLLAHLGLETLAAHSEIKRVCLL